MEHSESENPTPRFGYNKDHKNLLEELLGKKYRKSTLDSTKKLKNEEKFNIKKNEKSKSKTKSKEKIKNKSKEKSKSKDKSSKSKKKIPYSFSLPVEQKYENPFDIFLQKKIKLRDDFNQNNSEKFLSEKESAFQQFRMNEDADNLDN